jgi:hypothetical protein
MTRTQNMNYLAVSVIVAISQAKPCHKPEEKLTPKPVASQQ